MIIKKLNDVAQTNDTMYEIYEEKEVETVTGDVVIIPELVKTGSLASILNEIEYTQENINNLTEKKAKLESYKIKIEENISN